MSSDDDKAGPSGEDAKARGEDIIDDDVDVAEIEVPALSALLKRSLAPVEPEAAGTTEVEAAREKKLLLGVQRKLRQRSKGKFYADGWSTSQSRVNYALVAGVMLAVIVAVYLALGPMGISPR
jgi:hypothetical protein